MHDVMCFSWCWLDSSYFFCDDVDWIRHISFVIHFHIMGHWHEKLAKDWEMHILNICFHFL